MHRLIQNNFHFHKLKQISQKIHDQRMVKKLKLKGKCEIFLEVFSRCVFNLNSHTEILFNVIVKFTWFKFKVTTTLFRCIWTFTWLMVCTYFTTHKFCTSSSFLVFLLDMITITTILFCISISISHSRWSRWSWARCPTSCVRCCLWMRGTCKRHLDAQA